MAIQKVGGLQTRVLHQQQDISLLFFILFFNFHILNWLRQLPFLTQDTFLKLAKSKLPGRQKKGQSDLAKHFPYEARSPEVLLYIISFIRRAAIPHRLPSEGTAVFLKPKSFLQCPLIASYPTIADFSLSLKTLPFQYSVLVPFQLKRPQLPCRLPYGVGI